MRKIWNVAFLHYLLSKMKFWCIFDIYWILNTFCYLKFHKLRFAVSRFFGWKTDFSIQYFYIHETKLRLFLNHYSEFMLSILQLMRYYLVVLFWIRIYCHQSKVKTITMTLQHLPSPQMDPDLQNAFLNWKVGLLPPYPLIQYWLKVQFMNPLMRKKMILILSVDHWKKIQNPLIVLLKNTWPMMMKYWHKMKKIKVGIFKEILLNKTYHLLIKLG